MKLSIIRALSLSLIAALTACSGGTHPLPVAPRTAPLTLAVVVPATSPQSNAIRPMFIAPSTASVSFAQYSPSGPTTVVALTGANCTTSGGTKTCTATTYAPIGSDGFYVRTFASADGSGAALSAATIVVNVVVGTNNVTVTLNGVLNSVAFSPSSVSCTNTVACSGAAAFQALDAAGDIIIGPGAYAYDDKGDVVTYSIACPAALKLEDSSGTVVTSFNSPSTNTISKAAYDGSNQTGSLSCTATPDHGALSATFTLNFSGSGINWTIQ
jgi:hypothetical protein